MVISQQLSPILKLSSVIIPLRWELMCNQKKYMCYKLIKVVNNIFYIIFIVYNSNILKWLETIDFLL